MEYNAIFQIRILFALCIIYILHLWLDNVPLYGEWNHCIYFIITYLEIEIYSKKKK